MTDLPTLPAGWTWTTLDDVALSLRNGVFVSRPAPNPPGTRILRISAVRPNVLDATDVRYADPAPDRSEDYSIAPGDLLFTRYSGNPAYVGSCAAVGTLPAPTLHPDKLIRVVLDRDAVDPWFVQFAVNGGHVRREIEQRLKTTAGQVGISGSQLRSVPIPIAPRNEQQRIVAAIHEHLSRLDAADRALASARRGTAALRAKVMDRLITGAPLVRLGDLAEDARYGTSAKCSYDGPGQGVLRIPNVLNERVDPADLKFAIDPTAVSPALTIREGDVLFVRTNGSRDLIGRAAVADGATVGFAFASYLIRYRVQDDIEPGYLCAVVSAPAIRRTVEEMAATTAGQYNLSLSKLNEIRIPLPPIERQRELVAARSTALDAILPAVPQDGR